MFLGPAFHKDLLGDDDEAHSPPSMQDRSAEVGNLQNHVNSTSRSLQNAKSEREALEATLANQAAQISALQTQLDSAKAAFEIESGLLNTLKERHANQNAEIQKVREELIRNESDLSAIRVEKAEIEGSVLRDKEEIRDLNRRMAEVTAQITATKQEVDKSKKDAKQQKGLLAIARKQFATKESEKAKVDQELEDAQEDLVNTIKEREEVEAELEKVSISTSPRPVPERTMSPADSLTFAAAHPLPVTPDITGGGPLSPSGVKSNNPFERLVMSSGASTPRSFSTASMPLPPGLPPPSSLSPPKAAVPTIDNPFGFSQFDSEPQPSPEVAPDNDSADVGVSTPKVKPMNGEFGDVVSSPTDEELFSTPPNSTTPIHHSGGATPHFPSLDSAAAHFPALDDIPSGQVDGKENETDLLTDLHDLDVNETDSDSDSDSEESQEASSQNQERRPPEAPAKNEPAPPVSFDDVFGAAADMSVVIAPPTPETTAKADVSPTQNGSPAFDAFGVPLTGPAATLENGHDSAFTFINTPANVASKDNTGISSFDEAFGKSPSGGPSQTVSSFSFDSAFEDNFDFGASSGAATGIPSSTSSDAPPPANGATPTPKNVSTAANNAQELFFAPVNGAAAVKTVPAQAPVSFDDTFSSGALSAPTNALQPQQPAADQPALGGISFEEAFGGLETSQALKLDDSFPSRASRVFMNPAPPPPADTGKQFPVMTPPTSPRGPTSPRVTSSIRSGSPQPRATSPPPRIASPKAQRPSTSSSSTKEVVHEKPAPPPRHSKLSVRSISSARVIHDD